MGMSGRCLWEEISGRCLWHAGGVWEVFVAGDIVEVLGGSICGS